MKRAVWVWIATACIVAAQSQHLTGIRQLTHGGQNAEAYWSPDGKRLIFQSTRQPSEVVSIILCKRSSGVVDSRSLCKLPAFACRARRGCTRGRQPSCGGSRRIDACQRFLLGAQRAAGVGGTRPPRLSPGGGNGKGGVQIPCCRRLFPVRPGGWILPRDRCASGLPQRFNAAWMRSPQTIWKWFSAWRQPWTVSHFSITFRSAR